MENDFTVGQTVFVGGDIMERKTIKDYESFGNLILYYMSDGTAYPNTSVFHNEEVWLFRSMIEMDEDEKDRRMMEFFGITDD